MIFLKNGGVIHGSLIEIVSDTLVKIQTKDKNIFVFKLNEVEKITKDDLVSENKKPQRNLFRYFDASFQISVPLSVAQWNSFPGNYTKSEAISGYKISLSGHFEIVKSFSLIAQYSIQKNQLDENQLKESWGQAAKRIDINKPWNFKRALGGIEIIFQISPSSGFNIYTITGIEVGNAPDITGTFNIIYQGTGEYNIKSEAFSSWVIDLGLSYRYFISKTLSINLNSDYTYSKPKINFISTEIFQQDKITKTFKQENSIRNINFGISLSYYFNR